MPEHAEASRVTGHRVVVEVALHDRFKPLAGLGQGIVHSLAELRLDASKLGPHALADRAPHRVFVRDSPQGACCANAQERNQNFGNQRMIFILVLLARVKSWAAIFELRAALARVASTQFPIAGQ